MDTGTWGLYYNYTWWGNAIQTASSVIGKPDFFGSQFEMLTSQQPNQVVNGNFDNWTNNNPDGWTVVNEDANNFVSQQGTYARIVSNDTASIQIKQTIFTIGKTYKVELDAVVNDGNVEGLKLNDATAAATIGFVNSTGHHTFYFVAAGTAFVINRKGGGATDISIDNVSVQIVRADNVEAVKCLADWIHETQILDV